MSFKVGNALEEVILLGCDPLEPLFEYPGEGMGELPKPEYLPPWEGGKSALLLALACPNPAKYVSFAVFCDAMPDCSDAYGLD